MLQKHLSEPWFSLVFLGTKTIEGRLNKGDFANLQVDSTITFYNDDLDFRRDITVKVVKKYHFSSFREMLEKKGLKKVLPTVGVLEDGVKVYRKYFSEQDERKYGVVGVKIRKIEKK